MTRSAFGAAILISGIAVMTASGQAFAQDSSIEKSKMILQSLEQKRPDYIALIQDVSGSMLTNGMLQKARQAALVVIKEAEELLNNLISKVFVCQIKVLLVQTLFCKANSLLSSNVL